VGGYLVDLFSWLADHGYSNPGTSPLRVLWFQGADAGGYTLGLYHGGVIGVDKVVTLSCPSHLLPQPTTLARAFYLLRHSACY
jgi:hypothetical protein